MESPKISVIIPSYNSSETIVGCLECVKNQNVTETYEVIVVDSSSDGTEKIISTKFPNFNLIHLHDKTIPAKARNIGAEKAAGEILAFTDSDCLVDKNWLQNILKNMDSGHHIIGGGVVNGRPENFISRAEYFIEFREFSIELPKRPIRFVPTCNFAIKKEIFENVGGFPNVRASEDTLFAFKLLEHGNIVIFDPEVKIKHLNRTKWRPYLKNQFLLGKYAAIVRKMVPMTGARFIKIPYAFPILPFVRTLRTVQFIFRSPVRKAFPQLVDFLSIYPIFLLGAIVWSYGFFCGARTKENLNDIE